jgi:hypothetical protein
MRKTVFIGAMKPMTAGHYQMIQQAINDSKRLPEETPADETYIIVSVQDRIKKGQFPIMGETAIDALADFYSNIKGFLSDIPADNEVNLIFVSSNKFSDNNPDSIQKINNAISRIDQNFKARDINVNVEFVLVKSGPPDYLISIAESSPDDKFILYVGNDDVNKYKFLSKYADNISTSSFERFSGGMSGTEVRGLLQSDELTPEQSERLATAFPSGVDHNALRAFYRTKSSEGGLLESVIYGHADVEDVIRNVFIKGLMK